MTPDDCPTPANATATCDDGVCGVSCSSGFDDCNQDPTDGCEAALDVDASNCGSCDVVCTNGCGAGECNRIVDVDTGHRHACAVTNQGAVWCWGENASGEVGDGGTDMHPEPFQVPLSKSATMVSCGGGDESGDAHSCALLEDNQIISRTKKLLTTDPTTRMKLNTK